MNKNILKLGLIIVLVMALIVGCAGNNEANNEANNAVNNEVKENETATETETETETEAKYADGLYFAKEEAFSEKSGWKYAVTIEVKDGMITSVDWSGVSNKAGLNKKELSAAGGYPMVENGGAKAPWHEQAELVEAYLIETQDPTNIKYLEDNYKTDAITGVSIGVSPMFNLAEQALAAGPQEPGPYKDGAYHAEEADFAEKSGFKYTVDVTVMFGNIESVYWTGVHKDGGDDKRTLSINGEYGLVEKGGAQAPWFEQAVLVEQHLLMTQDPTDIKYLEDNYKTDAITGVSIGVSPFFTLAEEALSEAK
jgi:major membrane immunogen (membrane-anchored lipoprotein)